MKVIYFFVCLIPLALTAQNKDSIRPLYNSQPCVCPLIPQQGERVPDEHPRAKYINDTTLWHWIEDPFGRKIYEVKPEYKDTITRYNGSVIEIPIWEKYPDWKKPVKSTSIIQSSDSSTFSLGIRFCDLVGFPQHYSPFK